jgi:Baseplate J-like protein
MALPLVMTSAGLSPQTATSLHDQIIAGAVALNPGLTANLPGTLIEDIASTDTAALVLIDQARVETVNSVTPYGCNLFILNQLGQIYGIQQGVGSNTSVYVVFTGTPGYVIPQGVIVSDGTYQYLTQEASVINTGGTSNTVYCIATVSGSWAVPANSVTSIVSSIPSGVTLTVTNPNTGVPSTTDQTPEQYREQVLAAGRIGCTGLADAIKTYVRQVSGVVDTLVSVRQVSGGWEVIVGGGDTTAVANAIFQAVGDPNILKGAVAGGTTVNVNLYNTPDTYLIKYVQPVEQQARVNIYWETSSSYLVSNGALQTACSQSIQDYINALGPGQPINLYEIEFIFQSTTANIVATPLLTYIQPVISIYNGSSWIVTPPATNTGTVVGDSEGYWYIAPTGVTTTNGIAP